MSKKERQAYRRGVFETLAAIGLAVFYAMIFIGFMAR